MQSTRPRPSSSSPLRRARCAHPRPTRRRSYVTRSRGPGWSSGTTTSVVDAKDAGRLTRSGTRTPTSDAAQRAACGSGRRPSRDRCGSTTFATRPPRCSFAQAWTRTACSASCGTRTCVRPPARTGTLSWRTCGKQWTRISFGARSCSPFDIDRTAPCERSGRTGERRAPGGSGAGTHRTRAACYRAATGRAEP